MSVAMFFYFVNINFLFLCVTIGYVNLCFVYVEENNCDKIGFNKFGLLFIV